MRAEGVTTTAAGRVQGMRDGDRSWARARGDRDVFEKAYRRKALAPWDAKWHGLSVEARRVFLENVKGPFKKLSALAAAPGVPLKNFPAAALNELTAAGFVKVQVAKSSVMVDQVIALDSVFDFAARVRALRRFHLLDADLPSELTAYVEFAFEEDQLFDIVGDVLYKMGIDELETFDETLVHFVTKQRWPGFVVRALDHPLAKRIVEVLRTAEGPISLAELPTRLNGFRPDLIRASLEKLIAHLVVFEDLDPETQDLRVGFLPEVLKGMIRAGLSRERPPLVVVEHPKELGPDGGVIVNDVRAVLLEVASEPPRLKQDNSLFAKEMERFKTLMNPLPAWLTKPLKWTDEARLNQAFRWAGSLELVRHVTEGKEIRLELNAGGKKWLSATLDDQNAAFFDFLTALPKRNEPLTTKLRWIYGGAASHDDFEAGDIRFLGQSVTVLKIEKGKRNNYFWDAKAEDYMALRKALDGALSAMEPGVFYRVDSVEEHISHGKHNPLNRGLNPEQVSAYWGDRLIVAEEALREDAGRLLIDQFLALRLMPLGCVRTGIDEQGHLVVAREPRCEAYFGRKVKPSAAAAAASAAKVVVQPDFSVIVIGLNPAPAAELAPFCERKSQGGGQGAMILKITRDSVVKAVSQGLKPEEIVARLQRHASNEVPANVLKEVREWSQWVRQVTAATLNVLRCPDRATADRVMGALKRQAERVGDTIVAVDPKSLTSAERAKLRTQGIIIQGHFDTPERKKPKKNLRTW